MPTAYQKRLPEWLRKPTKSYEELHSLKKALRCKGLKTVCEEAKCPNMGECFERGTATIMIMGDACTRNCGFCNIGQTDQPMPLDPDESANVARQIKEWGLRHAVITSVTRDDLQDGGAMHFARTIYEIRKICPDTSIEVLTPDFQGRSLDVMTVCNAGPDVFNHNMETVERLSGYIRSHASYERSLHVLLAGKTALPEGLTKSGLMVGLGETFDEVARTLEDLRAVGCDIVTIGQYLRPSISALPVAEYIEPYVFREYEKMGLKLGFKHMFCGPFVRSSYLADKVIVEG